MRRFSRNVSWHGDSKRAETLTERRAYNIQRTVHKLSGVKYGRPGIMLAFTRVVLLLTESEIFSLRPRCRILHILLVGGSMYPILIPQYEREHSRLRPQAMPTHLNLLLLEDSLNDAELMLESLRDAG